MLTTAELTDLLQTMRAQGVAQFELHPDGTPSKVTLGQLPSVMKPLALPSAADTDEALLFAHEAVPG